MVIQPIRNCLLAGIVVLIGSFLRVFRIGSESLWLDEGYSVHFVKTMTTSEIVFELPWTDNSPPLYYLLLDIWTTAFGYSESTIRLLSAAFGIATIVVIYLLGSKLYSKNIGLLSAGILAISPFHIWYAQDARMYTLLALLASLSFLFLLTAINEEKGAKHTIPYVVFTVALGYTHVFGLLVILSQSIFVFAEELFSDEKTDKTAIATWIKIQLIVGVLLIPYVWVLVVRLVTDGGGVWVSLPSVEYIVTTPLSYFGTSSVLQWDPVIYLGLLAFIGVLGVIAILPSSYRMSSQDPLTGSLSFVNDGGTTQRRSALLLVSWVLIPTVVPILITYTVTPIYVQRYTIPASIGVFILVARGVYSLPRPSARFVIVILLLLVLIQPLPSMYTTDQKEQWREASQYIEGNADGDDVVLLNREDLRYPFDYYFDSQDTMVMAASENTLQGDQRTLISKSETVWLVLSHINNTQEENMRQSLEQTHIESKEQTYDDVRVVKFVST